MTLFAAAVVVLRVGTIVPDGTGWARELRAHGREIESVSGAAFFAKARVAREQLPSALVAPDLIQRVLSLLADFRSEHR